MIALVGDLWEQSVLGDPSQAGEVMREVRQGDRVHIRYIGTLDNGRIFDSTEEHGPLQVLVGSGTVFPALEAALLGMRVGEAKNLLIPAAQAYGPRLAETS